MPLSERDIQKWADSILATPMGERAVMVAEDPSVLDVVKQALDASRATVAKLRDRLTATMHMKVTDKGVAFDCLCVDCETTRSVLEMPSANR